MSVILSLESIPVSVRAKGLYITNPSATAKSLLATFKTPSGGSGTYTIPVPAWSNIVHKQKIIQLDGGVTEASLVVFELY